MDTLTRRIRGIFASTNAEPPPLPDDGRPEPPASAVQIEDPELISLLSSPEIMNGQDGRRQSVWSMLETSSPAAGSNRSSVMMYSPLIPTSESVIELAEMEIVPVAPFESPAAGWFSFLPTFWPFPNWTTASSPSQDSEATPRQPPTIQSLDTISIVSSLETASVRHVWVPSTTKLSFETTWWGYRIYLPPPAMQVLDDQSVEAAKQTTIITAALVWFFSNLPIASFPPPLQPAMLLLQRLAPLVSYLGTFISWSWSTIRGFDNGHGVILTATWLLPIALIPSTWHARDFPPPSMPVSPASTYTPLLFFSPQLLQSTSSLPVLPEEPEPESATPIPTPSAPRIAPVPLPFSPSIEERPLPFLPPPSPRAAPPTPPQSVSTISSTGGPPKTKSKIKTLRRKLTRALT